MIPLVGLGELTWISFALHPDTTALRHSKTTALRIRRGTTRNRFFVVNLHLSGQQTRSGSHNGKHTCLRHQFETAQSRFKSVVAARKIGERRRQQSDVRDRCTSTWKETR